MHANVVVPCYPVWIVRDARRSPFSPEADVVWSTCVVVSIALIDSISDFGTPVATAALRCCVKGEGELNGTLDGRITS